MHRKRRCAGRWGGTPLTVVSVNEDDLLEHGEREDFVPLTEDEKQVIAQLEVLKAQIQPVKLMRDGDSIVVVEAPEITMISPYMLATARVEGWIEVKGDNAIVLYRVIAGDQNGLMCRRVDPEEEEVDGG